MTYDPPRLKDGADTPRELNAALDALRRGPGDSARVARVAAKLGPLLDASPPPPAPPTALPRVGMHTLKAVRLFVAGMAVGASVLWAARWQRQEPTSPAPPSHASEARPAEPLPSTSAIAPHADPAGSSNGAQADALAASVSQVPMAARAQGSEPPRRADRNVRRDGVARTRSAASRGSAAAEIGASAQQPGATPAPAVSPAERRPDQPLQPAAEPVPPQPSKGEVELLFEARTLRQRAPREALALLDQHAARFADGMLAPEREAMAIEILRGLGRTQQAAERLARYRARYPHSLHLPRLEKGR